MAPDSLATKETLEPEEPLSIFFCILSLGCRTAGASSTVDASRLAGTVVLSSSPETAGVR